MAVVLGGVTAGAGVKSVLDAVDVGVKAMDTMDTMDCAKAVWVRKVMPMEFESGVQGIFSGFSGVFGSVGRFFACITTMMEVGGVFFACGVEVIRGFENCRVCGFFL